MDGERDEEKHSDLEVREKTESPEIVEFADMKGEQAL